MLLAVGFLVINTYRRVILFSKEVSRLEFPFSEILASAYYGSS